MPDDTLLPFTFPAIKPKKVVAAFDGGRLFSDGGVTLLALAEKRVGIIERLSELFPDERDQERVTHPLDSIVGARVFAISCGHEDGNDLDWLREDPAFKLACGRLPDSGQDLCSQPTISRLENAPDLRDTIRLTYALIDQWTASYKSPPDAVILDIDDSVDVVHGNQQLSLFNAYYDERCFLPIHIYDTEHSRPVAVISPHTFFAPARRRAGSRSEAIFAAWSSGSDSLGQQPGSPSAGTVTMPARKS